MTRDDQRHDGEETIGARLAFRLVDAAEELGGVPRSSWWNRIFGAWLGPAVLAVLGVRAIILQRAPIYNPFFKIMGHPKMIATGAAGIIAGLLLVSLGGIRGQP